MGVVMIGVDPHKGSRTAVADGADESPLGQVRVRASAAQAERLRGWAEAWPERTWAVEGADGLGQQAEAEPRGAVPRPAPSWRLSSRLACAAPVPYCGRRRRSWRRRSGPPGLRYLAARVFGVGPVIAATVTGDVIHRLSLRGNRRLNHAIHMAAITQIRYKHSDGRAYHDKKIAEGKTPKGAPSARSAASSTSA